MDLVIRQARSEDFEATIKLLNSNDLPSADLKESNVHLFVGLLNNKIVASVGLEKYQSIGLFRSLAVDSDYRNLRIGDKLLKHLFDYCSSEEIYELYLLTTTADKYFEKYGFYRIDRDTAPELIKQTQEFADICPVSAVVMKKDVEN